MTIQQEILKELKAAGFYVEVWPPGEADHPHPHSPVSAGRPEKVIAAAKAAGSGGQEAAE